MQRASIVGFTTGVLIFAAQVFGQDAAALLKQRTQALAGYHSYEYTQETSTAINGSAMRIPTIAVTTVFQALNPGKSRQETKTPGAGAATVTISDGKNSWTYMGLTNQYTKSAADSRDEQDDAGMTANAKVTGSEFLNVDGEQRDCWVVESKKARSTSRSSPGRRAPYRIRSTRSGSTRSPVCSGRRS